MKMQIVIESFGGPEALKLMSVPEAGLDLGKIRVAIRAIGVNRADVLLRTGRYHDRTLPACPGFEAAGIVSDSNSAHFRPGDRVLVFDRGQGLYAHSVVVSEDGLIKIPDGISFQHAATLTVNGITAWYCITKLAELKAGETVVISAAASGVGLFAIQIAKALGARVIGVTRTTGKQKSILQAGADEVVVCRDENWAIRIKELSGGKGAQVAIDLVGGSWFRSAIQSVEVFGRVVSVANVTGEDTLMNVRDFYPRNISIHGFQLGGLLASRRHDIRPDLLYLMALIQNGKLKPAIQAIFPLEQAAAAHRLLESNATQGKILLEVQ